MSITNRSEAVIYFDVVDGNPNGDPDADNAPRVDQVTQQGLVSNVCLNRKLRNFVLAMESGVAPNAIFVTEGAVLAQKKLDAYTALGESVEIVEAPETKNGNGKARKKDKVQRGGDVVKAVRQYMCDNYWDIRTFGAVMNTDVPAGTVRGPVQLTFARSVDPIDASLWTITRMAVETAEEAKKQGGDNRTMGRKYTVPYALYRAHLFFTPGDAVKTGFTDKDFDLLKAGLNMMFEADRASGRGLMTMRAIYAFEHDNALGRAQAGRLFDRVTATKQTDTPTCFKDYSICVDDANMPEGVTLANWLV